MVDVPDILAMNVFYLGATMEEGMPSGFDQEMVGLIPIVTHH